MSICYEYPEVSGVDFKREDIRDAFMKGREFQNVLCTPKLNRLTRCLEALERIATVAERHPWAAADAANECVKIAKEAMKP